MTIEEQIRELVHKQVKEEMEKYIQSLTPSIPNAKEVYTNKDVMEMLQIDAKTLKKYRDEGYLSYTHPFDKYYYSNDDLQRFLLNEKIRYEAFN